MSGETKSTLEKIALGMAIASFLFTVIKAAVLIPQDIEQLRAEQNRARVVTATDHDLIQRIDERTAQMQKDLQELKARK